MAVFIPVPNTVRSSLLYLLDNQTIVNTLHFNLATEPTLAQMDALNTALRTWYTASFKPQVPSNVSLSAINTVGLWSQTAPSRLSVVSPLEAGTAPTSFPANVTYCASNRTGLRGRNYRGRFYWPGMPSTYVTSTNTVTAAFVAAVQAALGVLLTPANVANFIWVIASRYFNKLPRATGIVTPVTAVVGDLTLDSQRRRLPGRGA